MPVDWDDRASFDIVRAAAMRGIMRGTERVRDEAVRLILETDKTGRTYVRRGVEHQASAPGEPPASDRGQLVNSIRTEHDSVLLVGRVVVDAEHGKYLEYGTQTMEPRPFMRPALVNTRAAVRSDIADEINRVLRR
jgi:HK97 gp10 family phage protein